MRALTCGALIGAMLAGCNHAPDTSAKALPADVARLAIDTTWAGRVHVGGTAQLPEVSLVLEDGGSTRLVGTYAAELQTLNGAQVLVSGAAVDDVPGGALRVSDYTVTAIDGERPFVGVLSSPDAVLTLADGTTLTLIGLPDAMRGEDGAKVWLTGERSGSELRVRSAGIIRR